MTGSSCPTRAARSGVCAALLALVTSLVAIGIDTVTPTPADAAVQPPFPCEEFSAGAWDVFLLQDSDASTMNDVAPRDDPLRVIGPSRLGISVPAPGVRANDDNRVTPEWDVVLRSGPSHAKNFSLGTDGSYSWEPVDGYVGGDTFFYTYKRGTTGCRSWQVKVTIPPPAAARAVEDTFDVYTDRRTNLGTVLANDVPSPGTLRGFVADGCPETLFATDIITKQLTHGTLTLNRWGYISYDPNPGVAVGTTEFFHYSINSGIGTQGGCTFPIARVTLRFIAPPPIPTTVANPDVLATNEDTPLTIAPSALTANDTGATIFGAAPGPTAHGSLDVVRCTQLGDGCFVLDGIKSVIYTPNANYSGPDFFDYVIFADSPLGGGFPATGTVRVDVASVVDDPIAVADSFTLLAHTTGTFDVRANDLDPDLVIQSVGTLNTPAHGAFAFSSDGTFTYSPTVPGTYTFVYQLFGPFFPAPSVFRLVTLNVLANPAVDDSYTADEDVMLTVPAPGVLANDENASLTPATVTSDKFGSVTIREDGSFDYRSRPNFVGTDTFFYTSGLDSATVTITVNPLDDAPGVALNSTCPPGFVCLGNPDNRGDLDEGDSARLRGAIFDPERNPGTLVIDWGDGSVDQIPYPCAFLDLLCPFARTQNWVTSPLGPCGIGGDCSTTLFFDFQHVYLDDPAGAAPSYTITATATENGSGLSRSTTGPATVADVVPTITISPTSVLTSDGVVQLAGHLSDPGSDGTGTMLISWGDNSSSLIPFDCSGGLCPAKPLQSPFCGTASPACGDFDEQHTYAQPGTYTIEILVTNDDGSASTTATATISPPLPKVLPGGGTIVEGNNGTKTMHLGVRLSAPSAESVTVEWTTLELTGSDFADGSNDYTPVSGVLTFAPGETQKTVPVTVMGDAFDEANEYVFVSWHSPTNAVIGGFFGLGYGIIRDDDPPPKVLPRLVRAAEGNSGSTVVDVPVSLSAASGRTVAVEWTTVPVVGAQFSSPPDDYTSASGVVTFAPGETTKTVPVAVNGDTISESDEYVVVSFHNPTNATIGGLWGLGFGVIANDD